MKIGLVGTVSVGKTTLVKALAELPQFKDYKIATERSKYLRDLGIPLNTDSTLKGQTIFLAERVGKLQSRDALLQKVWGYEGQVNTRTVDTHIKRLRQKLGTAGSMIETIHGFGYQLIES
jgi:DNA-binding response OmpR family regulator